MSALRSNPGDFTFAGRRMSAADFFTLGETSERLELIDGVILMSPSPFPIHQRFVAQLVNQIETASLSGAPLVLFPDTDIQFGPKLVYRPDIAVYRAERLATIPTHLTTPPDFIIEILSPSTMALDLLTKRDDYERAGVTEYWAIDPANARLRAWRASNGRYIEHATDGDRIPTTISGLTLDLAPLRALATSL